MTARRTPAKATKTKPDASTEAKGNGGAPPAPRVALRTLDSLIPYARNSRKHSDAQVAQIAASIVEWGFTNPVLADATGIVAGHGRVAAVRLLQQQGRTIKLPDGRELPEGHIPVLDCSGWSEAQRRAYVIADNKLALNAEWDFEVLRGELISLAEDSESLTALLGFSDAERQQFTFDAEVGATDAASEWSGMPEYEDGEPCFRKVVVNFDDAAAVADFFKLIGQTYTDKTKSIWHPFKPNRDLKGQRWDDRSDAPPPAPPPAGDEKPPMFVDLPPMQDALLGGNAEG